MKRLSHIYVLRAVLLLLLSWLPPAVSGQSNEAPAARGQTGQQQPAGELLLKVDTSCRFLSVDTEGNVLLLDPVRNRLYKYLKISQLDSVIRIGGKGIGREGLSNPTELAIPNRQATYVLDRDNRRILLLNTNLKILREIDFLNLSVRLASGSDVFITPESFAVNSTGELFVLNLDDNTIYKFDVQGRFEMQFGGVDYGAGSIYEPAFIAAVGNNRLGVLEPEANRILLFDRFGIFQYTLPLPKSDTPWKGFQAFGDVIIVYSEKLIWSWNLLSKTSRFILQDELQPIFSAALRKEGLYVLFPGEVWRYPAE